MAHLINVLVLMILLQTISSGVFAEYDQRAAENGGDKGSSSGAVYVHWGSSSCPNNAELIYKGMVAGSKHDVGGGGANYLCLPEAPEFETNNYVKGGNPDRAKIYSAEYEVKQFSKLGSKCQHEAFCSVCRVNGRGSMVMIPAMKSCPSGWTAEYDGYLMAEKSDNTRDSREFTCFDKGMAYKQNPTTRYDNAAELFLVEVFCNPGQLRCPPYVEGGELTCVVCTK